MSKRYPGGLITTPIEQKFSVIFNGVSGFLSTVGNAAYSIPTSTSPFTVEGWVKPRAAGGILFSESLTVTVGNTVSLVAGFADTNDVSIPTGLRPAFGWYDGAVWTTAAATDASTALQLNIWTHVAYVFTGSTSKIYINGKDATSTSPSPQTTWGITGVNGDSWFIGRRWNATAGGTFYPGNISGFRFVNGTAVYTANFLPPVLPLPAIANTVLLTCQYPTIVDGSGANRTVSVTSADTQAVTDAPGIGYKGLDPALGATAPGVWTLDDVAYYTKNRTWPTYDPYIGNVSLLLHGNGTNGANNNTVLDSSTNNFTVTRNGNVGQGSATPFDAKAYSSFFVQATDYVTATANAGFNFGTGNFTIEFYGCRTATGAQHFPLTNRALVATTFAGCWWVDNNTTNIIRVVFYATDGTIYTMNCNCNWPDPTEWFHFAIVRTPTAITAYLNGTQVGTIAVLAAKAFGDSTSAIYAGRFTNSTAWFWPGCLSGIRVVKGTALYTTSFTPSAYPLTAVTGTSLIMCQANRYVDLSANNITVTATGSPAIQNFSPFSTPDNIYDPAIVGGSGYFDGTGDYLVAPTDAAFGFGTGNFTMETWFYASAVAKAGSYLIDFRTSGGGASQIKPTLYLATSTLTYLVSSVARITLAGIAANRWYYVVVSRVSGTTRMFVDGVQAGANYTDANNYGTTSDVVIGESGDNRAADGYFPGYISGTRIVKGSGVTTAPVPTALPTNITNTSLLLNYTNAGIVDNIMGNTGETVGAIALSSAQSKFGGNSIAVVQNSGAANYLSFPHRQYLDLTVGDFTIELWLYPTNNNGTYILNKDGIAGTNYAQYEISKDSLGRITLGIGAANGLVSFQSLRSASSVTLSAWNHIACVRQGTLLMVFVNGVLGTFTPQTITMVSGSRPLLVNYYAGTATTAGINGFINELRITRGVARYTGNFSVPTARFQDE